MEKELTGNQEQPQVRGQSQENCLLQKEEQQTRLRDPVRRICIVIGAGDLTVGEIPGREDAFCIAVDGGLGYCGVLGIEPDLLLGDFDSVSEGEARAVVQLEQEIPHRVIRLPVEKDDTDMLAALKEGLRRGYRDFRIYGGTGGRLDHTLANIQCLLYLKEQGAVGYLVDGSGMILVLVDEAVHFQKGLRGYLSLFSLVKESRGVCIEGMKYPLKNAVIHNSFPIGISNEFTGEEAVVSVEQGALVCMVMYGT